MAESKNPKNKYDPYEGMSEEEKAIAIKHARIFGLPTPANESNAKKQKPENTEEEVVEKVIVEEAFDDEPSNGESDDSGKKKIPEREVTDNNLTKTEEDVDGELEAFQQHLEREKRNAEITAEENEEEGEKALAEVEEAIDASMALEELDDSDVITPGKKNNKGKGKAKGKKPSLENQGTLPNFHRAESSKPVSSHTQDDLNNLLDNSQPSENSSEGDDALLEKKQQSETEDEIPVIVVAPEDKTGGKKIEKGPVIEVVDTPVLLDDDYINGDDNINPVHPVGVSEPENGAPEIILVPPVNNNPLSQSDATPKTYVEDAKNRLEQINPEGIFSVSETGREITYKYTPVIDPVKGGDTTPPTPYIAIINKETGTIVERTTEGAISSQAFNNLVLGVYKSLPEKPAVYEGNQVYTTEQVKQDVVARETLDSWSLSQLNNNLKENYGSAVTLKETEQANTYVLYQGTENEAFVSFHPVSHRVTAVEFSSPNVSVETKNTVTNIRNEAERFSQYCRQNDVAYMYLEDLRFGNNVGSLVENPVSTPKPVTPQTFIPGVTTKQISNGTAFTENTIKNAPVQVEYSIRGISTQNANNINPYTISHSNGNMAMTLRNIALRHNQLTTNIQQGISPAVQRMLENRDVVVLGTTFQGMEQNELVSVSSDDNLNSLTGISSMLSPTYNLTPIKKKPDFTKTINATKGFALTTAMQMKQTAMQNPIGEGMQTVALYTIMPFQLTYKADALSPLISGLNSLPNYNNTVLQFSRELEKIGLSYGERLSTGRIINKRYEISNYIESLGFSTKSLSTNKITELINKRLERLKLPSLSKEEIAKLEKEVSALKAYLLSQKLGLDKHSVSAFYIDRFKELGVKLPKSVTDLTNKRHFSLLHSALNKEIGIIYGVDITKVTQKTIEELLEKFPDMPDAHLEIFKLLSDDNFKRFANAMRKMDRRVMYFMIYLQRIVGQNDTFTGAIKTYRFTKYARQTIHYTHRAISLARRIIGRIARKRGWEAVTTVLRYTSSSYIKAQAAKPVTYVSNLAKNAAQGASKRILQSSVGQAASKLASAIGNKITSTTVYKTTEYVVKKVGKGITWAVGKKRAIETAIKEFFKKILSKVGAKLAEVGYPILIGAGIAIAIITVFVLISVATIPISNLMQNTRYEKTVKETYKTLVKKDNAFVQDMRDKINPYYDGKILDFDEDANSQSFITDINDEDDRIYVNGYFEPSNAIGVKKNADGTAVITEWGWRGVTNHPGKNQSSVLKGESEKKNEYPEIHERGFLFTFTDSPSEVYYAANNANGDLTKIKVKEKNINKISFKSNAREILSTASVITSNQYTGTRLSQDDMSARFATFYKSYAANGFIVDDKITINGVEYEGKSKVSLWSATHGYQTTASPLYTCNGCKTYTYFCNSDEWNTMTKRDDFKYNESKALPYKERGCVQHDTSETYNMSDLELKYCGLYHKIGTEYVLCCEDNKLIVGIGHTEKNIKGVGEICTSFSKKPDGVFYKTYSGYSEDRQKYSHTCNKLKNDVTNVYKLFNYDVSHIFGTTAYFLRAEDVYKAGKVYGIPSCCGVSRLSGNFNGFVKIGGTEFVLVFCRGHHNCNETNIALLNNPVTKTASAEGVMFYIGNVMQKIELDGETAYSLSAEITVNDYCKHYKASESGNVKYDAYKLVCNGHCYGHFPTGDHPCEYCTGHADKQVVAYIISSTDPSTQKNSAGKKEGYWDNLPFNTIFSADTCSGPVSTVNSYWNEDNVMSGDDGDFGTNTTDEWIEGFLNRNFWFANVMWDSSGDYISGFKEGINVSKTARQDVDAKTKGSWFSLYDIDLLTVAANEGNLLYAGSGVCGTINNDEWQHFENNVIPQTASEQQKQFLKWAFHSTGNIPYYPGGEYKKLFLTKECDKCEKKYPSHYDEKKCSEVKCKGKIIISNGFGKFMDKTSDEAGRQLYGLSASNWLTWCYKSAFTYSKFNNPTPPKLSTSSVQLKDLVQSDAKTEKYSFTADNSGNVPKGATYYSWNQSEFKSNVQPGDILVLRKTCSDCKLLHTQNHSDERCVACKGKIVQSFTIFVGWESYKEGVCKNSSCDGYNEKHKDRTICPTCYESLTIEEKGSDFYGIEMSPYLFEENVVIKKYDERNIDVSPTATGNKYVAYRLIQ